MRAYLGDVKSNSLVDACDLLTVAERTKLGGGDAANCASHTIVLRAFIGAKGIAILQAKLPQLPIAVSGDHATAPALTGSGPPTTFVYRGGRWLIGSP